MLSYQIRKYEFLLHLYQSINQDVEKSMSFLDAIASLDLGYESKSVSHH